VEKDLADSQVQYHPLQLSMGLYVDCDTSGTRTLDHDTGQIIFYSQPEKQLPFPQVFNRPITVDDIEQKAVCGDNPPIKCCITHGCIYMYMYYREHAQKLCFLFLSKNENTVYEQTLFAAKGRRRLVLYVVHI
jgi:hypothetical protein